MALTRKFLKALEIEDDKIDQIIEQHVSSMDAVKSERDELKEQVGKLSKVQEQLDEVTKERDSLKKTADENASYKEKYESERTAFSEYKRDVDAEREKTKKSAAYMALLKKAGVRDDKEGNRYTQIAKLAKFDEIELDENGSIKDEAKVLESIKKDWSGFIGKKSEEGANIETPPDNPGGNTMTIEQIDAIEDTAERQKATWSSTNIDVYFHGELHDTNSSSFVEFVISSSRHGFVFC